MVLYRSIIPYWWSNVYCCLSVNHKCSWSRPMMNNYGLLFIFSTPKILLYFVFNLRLFRICMNAAESLVFHCPDIILENNGYYQTVKCPASITYHWTVNRLWGIIEKKSKKKIQHPTYYVQIIEYRLILESH